MHTQKVVTTITPFDSKLLFRCLPLSGLTVTCSYTVPIFLDTLHTCAVFYTESYPAGLSTLYIVLDIFSVRLKLHLDLMSRALRRILAYTFYYFEHDLLYNLVI